MDFNKNYYSILGLTHHTEKRLIKKSYYKLSLSHHPDRGGNANVFSEITEAYDVLMDDEMRQIYDTKSRFGKNYDESIELLNYEYEDLKKGWDQDKFEEWKRDNQLNVVIKVDPENFNGEVEYERWVTCKSCMGSGKDINSKMIIKDSDGNILKIFEGTDGCDFCEGIGKDWRGFDCSFCGGMGKVGSSDCKDCSGEKRQLGLQSVNGIKLDESKSPKRIDYMGHVSKDDKDISGHLWIIQ